MKMELKFEKPKIKGRQPIEINNDYLNQYMDNFKEQAIHNPKTYKQTADLYLSYQERLFYVDPKKNPVDSIKFLEPIGYTEGLAKFESVFLVAAMFSALMILLMLVGAMLK